jgi:hypothetical protein
LLYPTELQGYPIKGFTEPGSAGQDNIAEGGRGRKAEKRKFKVGKIW